MSVQNIEYQAQLTEKETTDYVQHNWSKKPRTQLIEYQAHLIEKATHTTDRMKQTNDPKINAYNWLNIKYN